MFVGHLAVALGTKKLDPEIPLGASVAASFGIDLLWPLLLLAGVETVRVDPGNTAFTHLSFDAYPWSHSMVMVLVWALLATVVGRVTLGRWWHGSILGALVFSHWVLDALTHRPDLPLWPGGALVGLGLWDSIPATFLVEGGLFAVGVGAYVAKTAATGAAGRWGLIGLLALVTAIWASQPWAPPPPDAAAVAWVGVALWILPPWAEWIDRHRRHRRGG